MALNVLSVDWTLRMPRGQLLPLLRKMLCSEYTTPATGRQFPQSAYTAPAAAAAFRTRMTLDALT